MHRDPTTTTDDIERPYSGTLEENYSLHDVAQNRLVDFLLDRGFDVELWGIDRRHDDGSDGVLFDDKMDLRIWLAHGKPSVYESVDPSERTLVAVTEVKAKRNKSWFGVFNLRHYGHYISWTHTLDVPVFVYMSYLDTTDGDDYEVTAEGTLKLEPYPAYRDAQFDDTRDATQEVLRDPPITAPQVDSVWQAPDGQLVVEFDTERFQPMDQFEASLDARSLVAEMSSSP